MTGRLRPMLSRALAMGLLAALGLAPATAQTGEPGADGVTTQAAPTGGLTAPADLQQPVGPQSPRGPVTVGDGIATGKARQDATAEATADPAAEPTGTATSADEVDTDEPALDRLGLDIGEDAPSTVPFFAGGD